MIRPVLQWLQVLLSDNITLHDENKMLLNENKQLLQRLQEVQAQLDKAAGPEEARVELVLDMDLQDVADEDEFKEVVAQDVAAAVDGDASKIRVLSLEAGSIRVHMALDDGVCGDGIRPIDVASDLQQQAVDPSSRLKQGRVTKAAAAAKLRVARGSASGATAEGVQEDGCKVQQLQAEKNTLMERSKLLDKKVADMEAALHRNAEIATQQDELIREWRDEAARLRQLLDQEQDTAAAAAADLARAEQKLAAATAEPREIPGFQIPTSPKDPEVLQQEISQAHTELQDARDALGRMEDDLEGAARRNEQLTFQMEMTKRVAEERAQEVERLLAAQRDLQDQVDRLTMLSGWQPNDLPGHPHLPADGAKQEQGGKEAKGYGIEYGPPAAEQPAQAAVPTPGKHYRLAAAAPAPEAGAADEEEGGGGNTRDLSLDRDVQWKPMGKEDEVNLLKDLDVERDRCDALQDKIKLLETELGDLNEEHEVLVQERQVCTLCVCVWVGGCANTDQEWQICTISDAVPDENAVGSCLSESINISRARPLTIARTNTCPLTQTFALSTQSPHQPRLSVHPLLPLLGFDGGTRSAGVELPGSQRPA